MLATSWKVVIDNASGIFRWIPIIVCFNDTVPYRIVFKQTRAIALGAVYLSLEAAIDSDSYRSNE
jgi:hypothetical protein